MEEKRKPGRPKKVETTIKRIPIREYVEEDEPERKPGEFKNKLMFGALAVVLLFGGYLAYTHIPNPLPPIVDVKKPDTPKAAKPATLLDAKKFAVILKNDDGTVERRYGGSVSWRQNNPGLLAFGSHSKSHGALEVMNGASIFPSYEAGRKALYTWLFESDMKTNTLTFFVRRMYPKDIETVFNAVVEATKAKPDSKLEDLTEDQRQKAVDAIQKALDWRVGNAKVYKTEAEWKASE